MRLHAMCLAVAITAAAHGASAQSLDDLTTGVRVRVYGFVATPQGDKKYETTGQVAGRDSIRLVIVPDGVAKFDTLPFFAMTTLQMHEGQTTRAKLMATGVTVGALAGCALWVIARALPVDEKSDGSSQGQQLRKATVVSIPALAVLGLTIGAISDTDVWVTVKIPASVYRR